MECIILAPECAGSTALAWQVEDLGADWRCCVVSQVEQAMQRLRTRPAGLAVLTGGEGAALARALMESLAQQPLLAPPYVLGRGCAAPDGPLPPMAQLPETLRTWKHTGRLPALCTRRLPEATALAQGLLHALCVPEGLRAWAFLPDMAALTAVHPPLLTDLQHGLYPLIGQRHGMRAAAVERSLRLCVEATWSRGRLEALERFFGSSVDPDRGKPTNREFLCRVQERLTLAAERLAR